MNLYHYLKYLLYMANRNCENNITRQCIVSNLLIEDNIQRYKDDAENYHITILDYQTVFYVRNAHIENGINLDENHNSGWQIYEYEQKCNLTFDCENDSDNTTEETFIDYLARSPKDHYHEIFEEGTCLFSEEETNYRIDTTIVREVPFLDRTFIKIGTSNDLKPDENHNNVGKIHKLMENSHLPEKCKNLKKSIAKNHTVATQLNNTKETYLSEDSLIIKDIVMDRYGDVLNQYTEKTLKRKQKQQPLINNAKIEAEKLEEPTSLNEKGLYISDISRSYIKTPDSGLAASEDLLYGSCIPEYDETLRYSSTMFLKEALGEEYMNLTCDSEQKNGYCSSTPIPSPSGQNVTERSIRSSEVSTLLSTINGVESLYSTIDKSKKSRTTHLKSMPVNHPLFGCNLKITSNYESQGKSNRNPKFEELTNAISAQDNIIAQVKNAISFCKQSLTFLGSLHHMEAEKHLVLANYRKEALENELNTAYEEMEESQCFGTLHIEDLVFSTHRDERSNISHYYICLLQSGTTVLISEIVVPDRDGDIVFTKQFQFNNLLSDFEVHIKIFSMKLEHKKRIYGGKHLGRLVKMSSFELLGLCKVTISDLYTNNHFTLENVAHDGKLSSLFTANIRSSININYNVSGFLTIGTSNVLWNRRWCALDGYYLKYWNYPTEENEKEPLGMFNLSKSISHQLIPVDKTICSRPRTIMLQIKFQEDIKQIFLQADDYVEFKEWKKQLNSVLISLNNWKYVKHM